MKNNHEQGEGKGEEGGTGFVSNPNLRGAGPVFEVNLRNAGSTFKTNAEGVASVFKPDQKEAGLVPETT